MTPEHAKKLLPLVAAHADGRVIEAQNAKGNK